MLFRLHGLALIVISIAFGMMMSTLVFGFRAPPLSLSRRLPWQAIITATSPSWRQQNARRIYHHGQLSLASTKAPTVEVSPSDHGTTAIFNFAQSSSMIDSRIVRTLESSMNITTPTPIQSHAVPLLLNNYDVMASSSTGTGKTLMFGLPLLNQLLTIGTQQSSNKSNGMGLPMALIISPTRELAVQTAGVLNDFAKSDASLRAKINVCLGESYRLGAIYFTSLINCSCYTLIYCCIS